MLDWEGMLASTIFLPGCNFRCPYCQNPDLVLHPESLPTVSFPELEAFFNDRVGWIEGVCITGGEPCLHSDLDDLCRKLKGLGLGVKLDTNGSFPEALERLLASGLIDYVAMDVKAPLGQGPYRLATGVDRKNLVERVSVSIELINSSGLEHEYRTTVVPVLHGPTEIGRIAAALPGGSRYALQRFSPGATLDPRYADLKPFTEEDMGIMLDEARRHVPGAFVRGAPAGRGD